MLKCGTSIHLMRAISPMQETSLFVTNSPSVGQSYVNEALLRTASQTYQLRDTFAFIRLGYRFPQVLGYLG